MRGLHRRHAASGPSEPHYFDSLAEVPLAALGSISLADTDAAGGNENGQMISNVMKSSSESQNTLASTLKAS